MPPRPSTISSANLLPKSKQLTIQLRTLTRKTNNIQENLQNNVKEKRFRIATATYLFQGLTKDNSKKLKFQDNKSVRNSFNNSNVLNRSFEAEFKIQNAIDS